MQNYQSMSYEEKHFNIREKFVENGEMLLFKPVCSRAQQGLEQKGYSSFSTCTLTFISEFTH